MPAVAIIGGIVLGITTGEHHGHTDPHESGILTGTITSGTNKLRINNVYVALEEESVSEEDNCGSGIGKLGNSNHKLKINNKSVQCLGDPTLPHNGTAKIESGNSKIITV
jgi:hypothetical protein